MMVKLASPLDWGDFQQNPAIEVKISSRGWMLGDRQKVASEVGDEFVASVRKIEDELDKKNHKFAHVVSCGATEITGPNRNGDGWRGSVLKDQMHTYLKHAACFRNHRNKSTDDRFGYPKLAMYDPARGYGRLLVAYHATEDACKDKRDKVATAECDALDRGIDIRVSHGSSIPFDTCVICGNKAPERKDYCESSKEGGECDLFGCKRGLKKVANDGRVQFVDNPVNRFYDISTIALVPGPARQADRIAYALPFDMFSKESAENDGIVYGSAKYAEDLGLYVPVDFQLDMMNSSWQKNMLKAAFWLAEHTDEVRPAEVHGEPEEKLLAVFNSGSLSKIAAAVQQFAENGQMIGPRTYCKLRGGSDAAAEFVAIHAKTCAESLCSHNRFPEFIAESPILSQPAPTRAKLAYGCRLPEQCDLDPQTMRRGVASQVVLAAGEKCDLSELDTDMASKLAAEYLACQVLAASVLQNKL